MTWLLDTSVCVPLINRTDARAAVRLLDHSHGSVRLCSVVKAELYFGAQNSSRLAENLQRVEIHTGMDGYRADTGLAIPDGGRPRRSR